jgi:hypothetical protein
MRKAFFAAAFTAGVLFTFACSSSSPATATPDGVDAEPPADDAAPPIEVDASDASAPDANKPTGQCAPEAAFGKALTVGFGRIDGIVYAVQKPSDTACVFPNSDHVIVQVLMNGAVYRLVANVQGSGADNKIRSAILPHALPAPAFAEGWHATAPLDYVTTLGAHSDASFTALTLDEGVTKIAGELKIGDPIAIYGTVGDGRTESAHLIHRNLANQDGAIVVNPTTTPRFMLFHFGNQTF